MWYERSKAIEYALISLVMHHMKFRHRHGQQIGHEY
jgi:hypothetical protein